MNEQINVLNSAARLFDLAGKLRAEARRATGEARETLLERERFATGLAWRFLDRARLAPLGAV